VGVAFESDDIGVVDEPIDHGGSDNFVAEHLAPAAKGLVGDDDRGGSLLAAGDQLEERVCRLGFEGNVADLCRHRDYAEDRQAGCPSLTS
jgi:hypothetical protein